jgi:hypothetical protein
MPAAVKLSNTTLDRKYALREQLLAQGARELYLAERLTDHEPICVLRLTPELAQNPELEQRFVEQARAAANVRDDHVARILEVVAKSETGAYVVMEELRGFVLSELVERGQVPLVHACSIAQQVLAGLDAARHTGLLHPELSLHDIIVTPPEGEEPSAKIFTFGNLDGVAADSLAEQANADVSSVSSLLLQLLGAPGLDQGEQREREPAAPPFAAQGPLLELLERCTSKHAAKHRLTSAELSVRLSEVETGARASTIPESDASSAARFLGITESILIAPRIPPAAKTPNLEAPRSELERMSHQYSGSGARHSWLTPLLALVLGALLGILASWAMGVF